MNFLYDDGNKSVEYQQFLRALCDKDLLLNEERDIPMLMILLIIFLAQGRKQEKKISSKKL